MATFVLVHGAWHGGWCRRKVTPLLRAGGHDGLTPTLAERRHVEELRAAGILRKLWRVPGTAGTIGRYEAPDATALHEAVSSLPMWPWLDVTIEPLAVHRQERRDG